MFNYSLRESKTSLPFSLQLVVDVVNACSLNMFESVVYPVFNSITSAFNTEGRVLDR